MKPIIAFLIIVLASISISRFYIDDVIKPGQEFNGIFVVSNPTDDDVRDVSVKMYIYDLGVSVISREIDVDEEDHAAAFINWIVPERTKKGLYLARITAANDDERAVRHAYIRIV